MVPRIGMVLVAIYALFGVGVAWGQATVRPCITQTNIRECLPVSSTNPLPITGGGASATFGSAFPVSGTPIALDISGLAQPWMGLTNGGVNYGLIGVVDNTGTQLNGYTTGTAGSASTQVLTIQGVASMTPVVVTQSSLFPNASTAITGNSTGTTGAVVGTLTSASSVTVYICGFNVSAIGGTAAVGPVTVAGLIGSSMVFQLSSLAAGANFTQTFYPCIPASATATNITVTTTADGSASAVDVNSWGFKI